MWLGEGRGQPCVSRLRPLGYEVLSEERTHMKRCISAVPGVALASVALFVVAGCGHPSAAPSDPNPTTASSSSREPSTTRDTTIEPVHWSPGCGTASLTARVVTSGSEMSQPFLEIALTNRGTTRCRLRGYPAVTAVGHRAFADEQAAPLRLVVHPGSIYERTDPGPQWVELSPRHRAFFALGTVTAYQGGVHLLEITELAITPEGNHAALHLTVDLLASAPANQPIPVGVTAIQRRWPQP
jgi:hypothetical protein